jgi:transcriptional regulator with XRE-family HTH domain
MNTIAANLKALREKAELSINQLADRSGVAKGQISMIEADQVPNVGVKTLKRLAEAMGYESPAVFFDPGVLISNQNTGQKSDHEEVEAT